MMYTDLKYLSHFMIKLCWAQVHISGQKSDYAIPARLRGVIISPCQLLLNVRQTNETHRLAKSASYFALFRSQVAIFRQVST